MRHFENKGGRFLGSQKHSQTVSFGEHARVPSHVHHAQSHETLWTSRQKERWEGLSNCLIFSNRLTLLKLSRVRRIRRIAISCPRHSQGINRRAPGTQSAMRLFENKGGRFLGSQKNSQNVSFGEHARVPSHVHHARSHETLWTSRQKERSGESQTVSFSQIVSLVSDRLAFAEYGESPPPALATSTETYLCQPPTGERLEASFELGLREVT